MRNQIVSEIFKFAWQISRINAAKLADRFPTDPTEAQFARLALLTYFCAKAFVAQDISGFLRAIVYAKQTLAAILDSTSPEILAQIATMDATTQAWRFVEIRDSNEMTRDFAEGEEQ